MNPPKVRDGCVVIYRHCVDQDLKLSEEGFDSEKTTDNPRSFVEVWRILFEPAVTRSRRVSQYSREIPAVKGGFEAEAKVSPGLSRWNDSRWLKLPRRSLADVL